MHMKRLNVEFLIETTRIKQNIEFVTLENFEKKYAKNLSSNCTIRKFAIQPAQKFFRKIKCSVLG